MAKRKRRKNTAQKLLLVALAVLTVFSIRGRFMLITGAGIPQTPPGRTAENSQPPAPTPTPDNRPAKNEYTLLVNRANPLTEDHTVETRSVNYNGQDSGKLFDVRAAGKIEAMLNDAAAAGHPMYLVSTYRTIEYQKGLYNRKVNEYLNSGYTQAAAEEEAAKWVAIPGTSEHNLGLVADIVSSTWYNENSDLTQEFENTAHFTWLYENCADYGFILRYPKGKESITGIVYEPWHYRYVGEEVAHYIMENNLTLEEFWEE